MDGYREEGSSSQDRPPIPIVHEIGESSGQAEKALQIVTAVTMFKQLMENPRFMEFIQSSSKAHQVQGSFGMPRTVFRGMQGMVPNPMYTNIGLHPGFQGTQGQFGVSQGNLEEAKKWFRVTVAGYVVVSTLIVYNFMNPEHIGGQERPEYSYLHIRNKEFPWGADGLFEVKHHDH
ncbi:hypothetical protein L7F22_025745 [Adiantum nelumboides]|nr:hypothetical protein [Adiantum nelumboides]